MRLLVYILAFHFFEKKMSYVTKMWSKPYGLYESLIDRANNSKL